MKYPIFLTTAILIGLVTVGCSFKRPDPEFIAAPVLRAVEEVFGYEASSTSLNEEELFGELYEAFVSDATAFDFLQNLDLKVPDELVTVDREVSSKSNEVSEITFEFGGRLRSTGEYYLVLNINFRFVRERLETVNGFPLYFAGNYVKYLKTRRK